MINPSFQIVDEIHIQVARGSVWRVFTRLEDWPLWNSEIIEASWLEGEPWTEGAVFELRHKSLFGAVTATRATLRMVVPEMSAVWESQGAGMHIINSAHFQDDLGGCKLTAKHAYSGIGAAGLMLLKGRQQAKLAAAMEELKQHVERGRGKRQIED
jgi:hypothetical protein